MSKVPETLQRFSLEHHGEVVLVGAPEQLLVRDVGVRVRQGPGVDQSPQCEDVDVPGHPGAHVCRS